MAALPPTNVSISGQTCEMAALLQSASSSSWSICTPDSMSLCLALTPSTSWKARQYSLRVAPGVGDERLHLRGHFPEGRWLRIMGWSW